MAEKTFTGASSGLLNVAGNWSPSGVPVEDDVLIFDENSPDVTGDYTHFAAIPVDIRVLEGCTTAFGDDDDYPEFDIEADKSIRIGATGISGGIHNAAGAGGLCDITAAPNTAGRFSLTGTISLASVGIRSGQVTIKRDPNFATHSRATVLSGDARIANGATVNVEANVTATTGYLDGVLVAASNLTDWTIGATGGLTTTAAVGVLTCSGSVVHSGTGNVGSIVGLAGGSFTHEGTAQYALGSSAKLQLNGSFNLRASPYATLTNGILMLSSGDSIVFPAGAELTVTMPLA